MDKAKPLDIPKREIWDAFKKVRANQGAAGIDGQTITEFEADLASSLYKLWNRMSSGSYHPPPVRRVMIAKAGGGERPLGVPTVADRVAQEVVKRRLERVLEPIFHDDSYGYRPGRSAIDAIRQARQRCWRSDWVLDIDIESFFDTIDWGLLLKAVRCVAPAKPRPNDTRARRWTWRLSHSTYRLTAERAEAGKRRSEPWTRLQAADPLLEDGNVIEPRLTRRQFVCSSAATAVAFAMAALVGPDAGRAARREDVGMLTPTPKTIHLKDYTPPAFLIPSIDLDVALFEDHARVRSRLVLRRNPQSPDQAAPLRLDGDGLELEAIMVDGRVLTAEEYALDDEHLSLTRVPNAFTLETVCRIRPQENTQLIGLYVSKNGFFTQCEAEGFRRITFFIDRPDVMARYTTTLHADKERYPVLLSNGNPSARGDEAEGRHWVRWEDPFPKPSYLFALVAARLDTLEDAFVTRSGKGAMLQIFVEPGKLDQCGFSMEALKKAMSWDEKVFGLELDLNHYTIVAVSDFNMGAMENKGLNIFNTKAVLARSDIATDDDFRRIDCTVAHEYFHNWTGNRVTCRDWFQLSLKEGLTVFRDQEYGADVYSRPVQRRSLAASAATRSAFTRPTARATPSWLTRSSPSTGSIPRLRRGWRAPSIGGRGSIPAASNTPKRRWSASGTPTDSPRTRSRL